MRFFKKPKTFFQHTRDLLVAAAKGFTEDKVPKLSSSLAYVTVFSIAPLLTVIISAASIIYTQEAIEGKLFNELNEFMGADLAAAIQEFVRKANLSGKSNIALIAGIISLFIGSTAVFTEIQDSINTIWQVKAVPKKGWKKLIQNRLLSFSLIISLGFLLLVSLVVSSIIAAVQQQLKGMLPFDSVILINVVNFIITLCVITFLFAVIFKVLPDVKLPWKPALIGAAFTALLFMLGKYLIQVYIQKANPGLVFGAAGSVVLILVWIYYTAFILYFGAEFTQAYAEKFSNGIQPSKYAVHVKLVEEEKEVSKLPAQHPEETKT